LADTRAGEGLGDADVYHRKARGPLDEASLKFPGLGGKQLAYDGSAGRGGTINRRRSFEGLERETRGAYHYYQMHIKN